MSSIFQQEVKKPAPKYPIPRSRSDFNYVGLTAKEKRWTTDFSLLLPAFPRDSSGYARLTETPVTIQPKTKTTKHLKSPYTDSGTISSNHCTESKKYVQNPCNKNFAENKRESTSQPVVCCRSKQPINNFNQICRQHLKPEVSIRKSPTFDPKMLTSSPLKIPNIICRSPTLDPTVLTRSPKEANRWPPSANSKNTFINRSPLCGETCSSDVVRSQSLRSLRRSSEKSPTKLRTSESAQSDVTGSSFKPSTVVEADELEDDEDIRRLRHFSVTPKGLINWGDSFRSHSLTSVHPASNDESQWDVTSTRSYPLANSNSQWSCNKLPLRYKVAIMGLDEVGKTSLIRQFQTSEYICAFDTNYDVSNDYVITVILNEEESELEFLEYRWPDEEDEKSDKEKNNLPLADAHVVVYSVTSRRSFLRALDILSLVQKNFRRSAVILVGNKSDLVRVRAVTTDEGQTSAKEIGTLFIETSAAINHQVDELLVSILSQIRTKTKSSSSCGRWSGSNNSSSLSKAKGLIKKFLKKACFQSKSCDNLQRL